MPVSASAMAWSIVKVVLIPVVAGILIGMLFPRVVAKINAALPWISVAAISAIVCIVVGCAHDTIATAGALVFAAVVAHNACGYLLGYIAGVVTKQPIAARRTMAVEVGMQNSGLATSLASTYMNPLAALPGAVFSVWHNLSGAVLAAICRYSDSRK